MPIPNAPSSLTASAVSTTSIGLTWTNNSTGEDIVVQVYRATDSGGPFDDVSGGIVQTPGVAFLDTGLTADTTYYYQVVAIDTLDDEQSVESNTASATTLGTAEGNYADQEDVQDLIGPANLTTGGDMDSDGQIDSGLVQRALDFADGYIDLELQRNDLDAPTDVSDATRAAALTDIAAHLAVWRIWHHRGLFDVLARRSQSDIAGLMSGYKAYADEQLAKLIGVLQAEDPDDDATEAGSFSFVPITRECESTTDENSQ